VNPWLIVFIVAAAVVAALGLWSAVRGSPLRPAAANPPTKEGKERELTPREKLARDGGMASFGLNPPWWISPDRYRDRVRNRRKS